MQDKKIDELKTGMGRLYIVLTIFVVVIALGGTTYYFTIKKNQQLIPLKIRKRKIHK